MAAPEHTLPVFFTTRTQFPLPSQKFMIPASWRRYQLSQLVNKALALAHPVPFDFIIKRTGELLRGSLKEWCEATSVGMEETLEIEYVESLLPPSRVAGIPHDDWVSDVSCGMHDHLITASYDGLVRIFDFSREHVHTISGHTAPVTSVCVLPSAERSSERGSDVLIASASHDTTARLTSYNVETKTSRALTSFHLHASPISSIAASPTGNLLLTTGWDSLIGLWDSQTPLRDEVELPLLEESKTRKRRRVAGAANNDTADAPSTPKRKAPQAVLKSHTSRVTSALFSPSDARRAYSASLDTTIRTWDVEVGICLHTQTVAEAPFIALAHLTAPDLLAAASTDRTVRIFDTRVFSSKPSTLSNAAPIVLQHASTPAVLAPSPTNAHHVASGGYDGIVRIWDVRSIKGAVASFRAGEGVDAEKRGDGKVLGLDWTNGAMVVGGEAGVDIWRVPERAEEAP